MNAVPGPFFIYSSNVDGHFHRTGFDSFEITEIHGSIERWQCSEPCTNECWVAPDDFTFEVDTTTMLAHSKIAEGGEDEIIDWTVNDGFIDNHPRCKFCGTYSRPSILMFGDVQWVRGQTSIWSEWKMVLEKMMDEDKNLKLAILENGCGTNVPSVRLMGERQVELFGPSQCSLIRINLDDIEPTYSDFAYPEGIIGLKGRSLATLKEINTEIEKLSKFSNPDSLTAPNDQ